MKSDIEYKINILRNNLNEIKPKIYLKFRKHIVKIYKSILRFEQILKLIE